MFLHLTTLHNLDREPIGTVDAQFVGGHRTHTWLVVATTPHNTGDTVDLYPYGPFATDDGARAWAEAHLAPYSTYTVSPLTAPYTSATVAEELGKPLRSDAELHAADEAADRVAPLLAALTTTPPATDTEK
ncbi:hypothetical protein [Streptomyces sp. NPDC055140]